MRRWKFPGEAEPMICPPKISQRITNLKMIERRKEVTLESLTGCGVGDIPGRKEERLLRRGGFRCPSLDHKCQLIIIEAASFGTVVLFIGGSTTLHK